MIEKNENKKKKSWKYVVVFLWNVLETRTVLTAGLIELEFQQKLFVLLILKRKIRLFKSVNILMRNDEYDTEIQP